MIISLITPTYNSAKTILDTLKSVSGQIFNSQIDQSLEYIIIDGASKDDTLKIIREYSEANNLKVKLISEPDHGLYDAMNKGIKIASGDLVGILNSDDIFKDNQILSKVAACFNSQAEIDACYGDLEFVSSDDLNKVVRFWRAGNYQENKLNNGWIIPHPTFFARRSVYEKFGFFRSEFKIAGDYELMLRFLKINKIKTFYLPEVLTRMRIGGVSSQNLKQRRKGWRELKQAWRVNNLKVPPLFIMRRIFFKLKQYL